MKIFLLFLTLSMSFNAFCKRFDITIHNSLTEPIDVSYAVKKNGKTKISEVQLLQLKKDIVTIRLNTSGDEVVFSATTLTGKTIHSVVRTYDQLTASLGSEDALPTNVNLVEFSIMNKLPVKPSLGEALRDYTDKLYMRAVNDTNRIRVSDDYDLGTFVIFKNGEVVQPFAATNAWKNKKTVKEGLGYNQSEIFRIKGTFAGGAGISIESIGLGVDGGGAKTKLVDHIYKIYNFKESYWVPEDDNPQVIFSKYHKQTGYDVLKELLKLDLVNNSNNQYKVLFINSVSTTDSIRHYSSNYVSIGAELGLDLGLPPSGKKVVKLDDKMAFLTSDSFEYQELQKDITNYFKVMDITTSCLINIAEEIGKEREEDRIKTLKLEESKLETELKEKNDLIIEMWKKLCSSTFNDYDPNSSLAYIRITPVLLVIQKQLIDGKKELSTEDKEYNDKAFLYNEEVQRFNDQLEASKEIGQRLLAIRTDLTQGSTKEIRLFSMEQLEGSEGSKLMSNEELKAIIKESQKDEN